MKTAPKTMSMFFVVACVYDYWKHIFMTAVAWYSQGGKCEIFHQARSCVSTEHEGRSLSFWLTRSFQARVLVLLKNLVSLIVINFMETLWEVRRLFGPWGNHNQETNMDASLWLKWI